MPRCHCREQMRLTLHPRLSRIVRALPQGGPLAWLEIALLAGLAIQLARLFWTIATPVAPLGDWRPPAPALLSPAARDALIARFDPFFRGQAIPQGPAVVTSLSLKLFGIRLNEAAGGGSAIIATPDGVQSSIAVGQEVLPGVKLTAVTIDHVVIDRGGVEETLYLDQSAPAAAAVPVPGGAAPLQPVPQFNAPPTATPAATGQLRSQVGVAPRIANGVVSGLTVSPRGDGLAFRSAGLRDGDVIVRIDGRPVSSVADAQALEARLAPGSQLSVAVERGAQVVPLTVTVPSR